MAGFYRVRQVLALALLAAGVPAHADDHGSRTFFLAPAGEDTYTAGRRIEIRQPVQGDLVVAGSMVRVNEAVAGDVIAAGSRVEILGPVGDDARLAGTSVELAGSVAGHAVIAGTDVRVTADAPVADWMWAAGTRVQLDGDIGGELQVSGTAVELNGRVGGDVDMTGGRLVIGDSAVVEGNLTWRSRDEIVISDSAVVRGEIIKAPPPESPLYDPDDAEQGGFGWLFATLSLLLTAGALRALFPVAAIDWSARASAHPLMSFIVGLAVFATAPLVAVLLFATVIGWPLGLLTLVTHGLLLLVAGFAGINVLASMGLLWVRRNETGPPGPGRNWAALAVVSALVALVWPLFFLLAALGLGAMTLGFYARWSQ